MKCADYDPWGVVFVLITGLIHLYIMLIMVRGIDHRRRRRRHH
jgi:hypothetical protein